MLACWLEGVTNEQKVLLFCLALALLVRWKIAEVVKRKTSNQIGLEAGVITWRTAPEPGMQRAPHDRFVCGRVSMLFGAMTSTFTDNFTRVGSVIHLIVEQHAEAVGVNVGRALHCADKP